MAGRAVREEGLRAAALPGRVAAAYSMTLDAGPRAHERVGYINQSVLGLALREQVLLGREFEPSDGGVARVPQAREVLEVRAARLPSANIDVVVQALEPVWKSNSDAPRRMTSLIISTQVGTAPSAS